MRIRWVTPLPPDRDGGGGHVRQAHLLCALAGHHDVDLVVAGRLRDDAVRDAVATFTEVAGLVLQTEPSLRRRLRDLRMATVAGVPREVSLHADVRRSITARWDDLPPADVVLVELPALAPLVRLRRDERWLLTFHNLRSEMATQLAAVSAGRRQRWLLARDARLASRFEAWATDAYDVVAVPADDDAERFPDRSRVVVVPNGVDLARFGPSPLPEVPRLLFAGALYTGPNIDGARWLATEILPRVRTEMPGAVLDVVGLDPVPEVARLGQLPGVAVHADVSSVVPYLAACRVACVPLRVGTGTRLKALEAMAAGRPVVGTTVGLAGLGIADGRHALVRDDAAGFAAAVVELLSRRDTADRLVAGGAALAASFAWEGIGNDFRGVVESLARDRPGRSPA